jgi:hypothetical protein
LPVEFLLCNRKEPGHAPTDNREGQRPKTRSKANGKHILLGMGTIWSCLTEFIASKAPAGSQAKMASGYEYLCRE